MRHTDSQGRPLRYLPRKAAAAPVQALQQGVVPPYPPPPGSAVQAPLPVPADLGARVAQLEEEVDRLKERIAELEEADADA